MHIMLFGGAFDPPHNGHHTIVSEVLEQEIADQVWIVPVGNHPCDKELTAAHHRIEMLHRTFHFGQNIHLKPYETQLDGTGYTFQTLRHFKAKYPQHRFSLLIGADNVARFDEWRSYKKLLAESTIFVYPRPGYPPDFTKFPEMKYLKSMTEMAVSSTQVKEQLQKDLVSEQVFEYIKQFDLYK